MKKIHIYPFKDEAMEVELSAPRSSSSRGRKRVDDADDEEQSSDEEEGEGEGGEMTTADKNVPTETLAPRPDLPPLLQRLQERRAEQLDWVGVSFGLTLPLLKFWKRQGFVPM
jgi:hypothetical protein